jgi:hypothetical protein
LADRSQTDSLRTLIRLKAGMSYFEKIWAHIDTYKQITDTLKLIDFITF